MKKLLFCMLVIMCITPASAQFLEQITVKEAISMVESSAQSDFAADAVLTHAMFYGVNYQNIQLEMDVTNGKASGWVYRYYSPSENAYAWYIAVKVTLLGLQTIKLDLDSLTSNMPIPLGDTPLSGSWVDSDAALQGSKDGGAETFLQQNPETRVILSLLLNNPIQSNYIPTGQYWLMSYGANNDTLNCIVHAESGLPYRCLGGNAPQITSLPTRLARVHEPYHYTVTAWGNPVPTYQLTTAPSGMKIDEISGGISWTPIPGQEGEQQVTVMAVNSSGSDSQSFTINVQGTVIAPIIISTPETEAFAGKQYTYQLRADGIPPPKYFFVESPSGMIIDSVRGTVYWTPARAHAGAHTVKIKAVNNGGSTEQHYTLEVYTTPIIPPISNKLIAPNLPFRYQVKVDARPQPVFMLNAAPAGMDIDTSKGVISWTPTDAQRGMHVVLLQATNRAGMHQQSFEITVDPIASATIPATPDSWACDNVWPLPVRENAHITITSINTGVLTIEVYDALGRNVASMLQSVLPGNTTVSVPTASLTNGSYLLRISMNGETVVKGFVIAK